MSHTAFKVMLPEEFPVIPNPTQSLWSVNIKNEFDKTELCKRLVGHIKCVTAEA